MATSAAAAVSIPSFCGLNAQRGVKLATKNVNMVKCAQSKGVRASINWEKVSKAVIATGASIMLVASPAMAAVVKMGGDDGSLQFIPSTLKVPAGETILFQNNKGFPHNVVFDDEGVPEGVKVEKINHEDYLNSPSDNFSITLSQPGTYKYFCEPHQGAGMAGTIEVS